MGAGEAKEYGLIDEVLVTEEPTSRQSDASRA